MSDKAIKHFSDKRKGKSDIKKLHTNHWLVHLGSNFTYNDNKKITVPSLPASKKF